MSTPPTSLLNFPAKKTTGKPAPTKRKPTTTNAAPNTPAITDDTKKTRSLSSMNPATLQSLLLQLSSGAKLNSDGDSFTSSRGSSRASNLSTAYDGDDESITSPVHKRSRPSAETADIDTTEARPERPPLQLFDPLTPDYHHTGLVDLPKVTIPSRERDVEAEQGESGPTLGRNREKMDAIFDFLLAKK